MFKKLDKLDKIHNTPWIGAYRNYLQWHVNGGDTATWNSQTQLPITMEQIEDMSLEIGVETVNKTLQLLEPRLKELMVDLVLHVLPYDEPEMNKILAENTVPSFLATQTELQYPFKKVSQWEKDLISAVQKADENNVRPSYFKISAETSQRLKDHNEKYPDIDFDQQKRLAEEFKPLEAMRPKLED